MNTSEVVRFLISDYNGQVVSSISEANDVLKKYNTRFYVYLLICDGEVIVLGEGSNRINKKGIIGNDGRKDIIFPGGIAFGHQKAFPAAMAHLTSTDSVRIIIPAQNKDKAKEIEKSLKISLCFGKDFGGKTLNKLNMELYRKRLKQLNMQEDERVTILLDDLINAQGCEMHRFKQKLKKLNIFVENFSGIVTKLFGGYYADLIV